jgi:malate permease and related proteins
MLDILNVILPTFIVIFFGFLIGKFTKIDLNAIIDVLFWLGIPVLGFSSTLNNEIILADAGKVWASALLVMIGCGLVGWIVFRMLRHQHSGVYLPIMLMNTINIPFPIISLLYGSEGLLAAVLFYIPNTILINSLGIVILSKKNWKDGLKEMFKVPAIYAVVLGITLNLLNVQVPELVMKPLNIVGAMVVPLVLLLLGSKLASVKITSLPTTVIASVIRLGVGLLLGFAAVQLFHLTGILRAVVIFDAAMPSAVNTSILAMKYDNEPDLVSSIVFLTTIASLVMIPFLLWAII